MRSELSLMKQKSKIYLFAVSLLLASLLLLTPLTRFFYSINEVPSLIITVNQGVGRKVQPQKFSMLVWNIYKGQRFPKHPLPFSPVDYDFALIQEDYLPKSKIHKKSFTKSSWGFLMPTFKMKEVLHGSSFYSKYKPTKIQGWQTKQKEPIVATPKSFIVADFNDLRIINVHAINFVTTQTWHESMKEIFAKTINKEFVVLAGDFNTWNKERRKIFKELIKSHQLQEVVFKNDNRTRFDDAIVDYVLAKGLKLRSAEVMKLENLSDHNPMEVVFERVEN